MNLTGFVSCLIRTLPLAKGINGNPSKGIKYPRIEIVVASNRPTLPLANGDERSRIISWHEHYFN